MHVVRRKKQWPGGEEKLPYLYLRETFQTNAGPREHVLYLGPERAEDLEKRADRALRRRGFTPAQRRAVLEAVRARVERNEHVPIQVRGKPVAWRHPKTK